MINLSQFIVGETWYMLSVFKTDRQHYNYRCNQNSYTLSLLALKTLNANCLLSSKIMIKSAFNIIVMMYKNLESIVKIIIIQKYDMSIYYISLNKKH